MSEGGFEPQGLIARQVSTCFLYIASIVTSAIGETSAYFLFLSVAESALLLLIIWYAWTWPRQEASQRD